MRCIVSNLTDDGSYELLDELVKGQPLLLDEGCHSDDEDEDWQKWMPDPVDADPCMVMFNLKELSHVLTFSIVSTQDADFVHHFQMRKKN